MADGISLADWMAFKQRFCPPAKHITVNYRRGDDIIPITMHRQVSTIPDRSAPTPYRTIIKTGSVGPSELVLHHEIEQIVEQQRWQRFLATRIEIVSLAIQQAYATDVWRGFTFADAQVLARLVTPADRLISTLGDVAGALGRLNERLSGQPVMLVQQPSPTFQYAQTIGCSELAVGAVIAEATPAVRRPNSLKPHDHRARGCTPPSHARQQLAKSRRRMAQASRRQNRR